MIRSLRVAAALLLFAAAPPVHADIDPPRLAPIMLELTVGGQETLPLLRLFVTNCREPVESSVLQPDAPLVCNPKRGPVRVFGFREGDLVELFDMIRRGSGDAESAAFLARKAKTCGEVAEQDRVFLASTDVALVAARYRIEPGPKGGCKLTRISATTKTRKELQGSRPPAPSVLPAASSSAAPVATPPAPPGAPAREPAKSGCGCRADRGSATPSALIGLALAGRVLVRRRRSLQPF